MWTSVASLASRGDDRGWPDRETDAPKDLRRNKFDLTKTIETICGVNLLRPILDGSFPFSVPEFAEIRFRSAFL
jgi:hypothetical protein